MKVSMLLEFTKSTRTTNVYFNDTQGMTVYVPKSLMPQSSIISMTLDTLDDKEEKNGGDSAQVHRG